MLIGLHYMLGGGECVGPGEMLAIEQPISLNDAIGIVRGFPPALFPDTEEIAGIGVFSPQDRGYLAQIRPGIRDAYGRPLRCAGQNGVVCAIFADLRGVLIRMAFPGDDREDSIFPVDVRPEDIAGIPPRWDRSGDTLTPLPDRMPGWTIRRLDDPSPYATARANDPKPPP